MTTVAVMSEQFALCAVRCPVCGEGLRFEHRSDSPDRPSLWGVIPVSDLGCMEVTMPWSPAVEAHMSAHRQDGTWLAAYAKHLKTMADTAAAFFAERGADGQYLTKEAHA